jgi:hypothetical protein
VLIGRDSLSYPTLSYLINNQAGASMITTTLENYTTYKSFEIVNNLIDSPKRAAMVATQKLYPRGTVKRIVKAHAGRNISKNADVLVRSSTNLPVSVFKVFEELQTNLV